jgi:hypothetical protein
MARSTEAPVWAIPLGASAHCFRYQVYDNYNASTDKSSGKLKCSSSSEPCLNPISRSIYVTSSESFFSRSPSFKKRTYKINYFFPWQKKKDSLKNSILGFCYKQLTFKSPTWPANILVANMTS